MINIPKEIDDLIEKYEQKYKKKPKPWNYDEWESFDEYRQYLEKELKKE